MRVGVLGNCQTRGLSESLKAYSPDLELTIQTVGQINMQDDRSVRDVAERIASCDLVFIQDLNSRRTDFSSLIDTIKSLNSNSIVFPLVYFRGLHPDCGYVLREGKPVVGARGPYQSILACAGWIEGMTAEATSSLFNAFSYEYLGYFGLYAQSMELMTKQFGGISYDLGEVIRQKSSPFMHTVNHPTAVVLHEIASQALDLAGLPRLEAALVPVDILAEGPVWPVYPEIARRIGLPAGSYDSRSSQEIRALVEANYRSLSLDAEQNGALDFEAPDQPNGKQIGQAREFIQAFVVRR